MGVQHRRRLLDLRLRRPYLALCRCRDDISESSLVSIQFFGQCPDLRSVENRLDLRRRQSRYCLRVATTH